MKKSILIIGFLVIICSAININLSYECFPNAKQLFADIEALADDGEFDSGRYRCGYSCYQFESESKDTDATKETFTYCAEECPQKDGYNPLYKNCK